MLRRSALAIVTVLTLAGSAELIRLAASPGSGQTPRPSASQILGLRPPPKQLQPKKDRRLHQQSVQKSLSPAGASVDVSSIFLQAPTYKTGGAFPYAMVVTDVNHDGIPDTVVAECGISCNGKVGVQLGNGGGTFQPVRTYPSGGYNPAGLTVADVNGDGNPDLVVANTCAVQTDGVCTGNGAVGIRLGNGDGTFQPGRLLDTGALYATSVAVADLNADGLLDLVVTGSCTTGVECSGVVSILLANGLYSWQTAHIYSTENRSASSVSVADVDGDGNLDVVVANRSTSDGFSGVVSVLMGKGDGTLLAPRSYDSAGIYANTVLVADVNGDATPDLLVLNECTPGHRCNVESGSVGVLLGNGDGTFQSAQVSDSGAVSPFGMTVADVNGDGQLDVLVASRFAINDDSGNGAVTVLLSNGGGTFSTAHVYNSMGWTAYTVAAADVNGDGKPDVLVANWRLSGSDFTSDSSVAVMLGHGDGSFQAAPTYNPGGAYGALSAAIADLNGDGKADLVVTSECLSFSNCDGAVDILLGQGDGTFQAPQTYDSGGLNIQAVTVADVNADGKPDLLVANECPTNSDCQNTPTNGSVGVLIGNGDGSFQPVVTYDSGGGFTNSVAVADVNFDGKLDLIVSNQCLSSVDCTNGSITVLGNVDGAFNAGLTFGSGGYLANSFLAADVNGDGIPDSLVANNCLTADCTGNGQVAVLLDFGNFGFGEVTYDSGSTMAHSLLAVDVNADGYLDLVVANSDSIGVLLNNTDGTFQPPLLSFAVYGVSGHLAAADFNGDGKIDVASSDGSLLLGNGDGTFTATTGLLPTGLGISTGDLNGDGKPDLVIGGVTVLLNIAGQTTTALTSSLNPSVIGQDVTFTATVTSPRPGTPSGIVTFNDGGNVVGTVPLANGVAALTVSDLIIGTHVIIATYSGEAPFSASTSPALSQVVNRLSARISVDENIYVTDAPDIVNQQVTPTITWPAPAPITYGTPLSATQLNATANTAGTFVYTPPAGTVLSAGNQTLSVTFTPTDTANYTSAIAQVTLLVDQATSIVTWLTPTSITYGTLLSAMQLDATANTAGTFTYTPPAGTILSAGNNTLSVLFTPTDTANYTSASASVGLLVNQATTTVQLTSSANPQFVNQPITFTATITSPAAGSATGSVIFLAGNTTLGTVAAAGNTAFLTTSFSTAGNRSITAQYSGDNNYTGSTSAPLVQSVVSQQIPTTLTLTSSLNPSSVGQAVTFTATFGTGRPPDGETITFKRGSADLGTATIMSGAASLTTPNLPLGRSRITATYPGDAFFGRSSASIIQTVNRYATTTTLASNLNPATYGQTIVLTATVTTSDSSPATGTVTFRSANTSLGTATLRNDGTATLPVTGLAAGAYSLTATYNGDARNAKSSSSALNETVNPASSSTALTSSINPSRAGQSVKFSASVSTSTGAVAKGSVTFTAGSVTLGTVTLAGGKASISTRSLPPGANMITVTYDGNPNVTGSSATLPQQVN